MAGKAGNQVADGWLLGSVEEVAGPRSSAMEKIERALRELAMLAALVKMMDELLAQARAERCAQVLAAGNHSCRDHALRMS